MKGFQLLYVGFNQYASPNTIAESRMVRTETLEKAYYDFFQECKEKHPPYQIVVCEATPIAKNKLLEFANSLTE